jgi:cob(I)alamin adenosyltransferase
MEIMDKKAKKRIDLLQQKLQKLRLQLAGAKKQMDEPDDVTRLEKEVAATAAELQKLKES